MRHDATRTRDVLHVLPAHGGGWEVRHEHKAHPHLVLDTKADAIARARAMAESCAGEVVVHRRDFSEEERFGSDG